MVVKIGTGHEVGLVAVRLRVNWRCKMIKDECCKGVEVEVEGADPRFQARPKFSKPWETAFTWLVAP
jgi:hypothetical protein